jgi:hypothetical protein
MQAVHGVGRVHHGAERPSKFAVWRGHGVRQATLCANFVRGNGSINGFACTYGTLRVVHASPSVRLVPCDRGWCMRDGEFYERTSSMTCDV